MIGNEGQLVDPSEQHVLPSSAVVLKSEAMPPPTGRPARKKRRVVLSEDEYLDALGRIVERDYYPDNTVMRHQLQLLDASSSGGGTARVRLTDIRNMQHGEAAPGLAADEAASNPQLIDMSIDEFFARFTSEDNDSFEQIREKDMEAFKKKFHWVYEPASMDKASGYLMLYHMGGRELSGTEREKMDNLLEGRRVIGDDRPNQVNTWRFKVRNSLLFPPELEAHCSTSDVATGHSTAIGEGDQHLQLTDGSAMNSIVSALPARKPLAITGCTNDKVGTAARAEKAILRENTRIEGLFSYRERLGLHTPSPLEYPHTPTTVSSETGSRDSWSGDWDGGREAARRYHGVAMTPALEPGEDEALDNQLMTWGTLFATPIVIDDPILDQVAPKMPQASSSGLNSQGDTAQGGAADLASRFQIKVSERDNILRELDKKARKKIKTSIYDKVSAPSRTLSEYAAKRTAYTPGSSRSAVPMSPAAVALAERLSGSKAAKLGGLAGAASGLRESYSRSHSSLRKSSVSVSKTTPSSARSTARPSVVLSPALSSVRGATSSSGSRVTSASNKNDNHATNSSEEINLSTDGLLKI